MATLTKLITNKYNLAISSTIIGFCFWYFLSTMRPHEIMIKIPLSFYGEKSETCIIDTFESITVCLKGLKKDFYNLQFNNLAIHINADTLQEGKNNISISSEHLFLPHEIKLINCKPSNIVVVVKKNSIH